MKKLRLYWICQLVGWGSYVLLIAFINQVNGNELDMELFMNLLSTFAIGITTSHAYRYYIIKQDWLKLKISPLIPRVLLASFVLALLFYSLHTVLSSIISGEQFSFRWLDVLQNLINLSANYILWTLLYWSFHFIQNYRKEEIKNLQWQAMRREMELNRIKSQLNPHFIFNSMNSIRALVDEQPDKAKNLITQLSNILRSSLYMDRKPVISFVEEISLVRDYLGLEKARLEERLTVELDIDEDCYQYHVPPLLLQTLVENGIKHGIARLEGGGTLAIKARVVQQSLHVEINNSAAPPSASNGKPGIGLKLSRDRLHLLYGDASELELIQHEDKVTARLVLPAEPVNLKVNESIDY